VFAGNDPSPSVGGWKSGDEGKVTANGFNGTGHVVGTRLAIHGA
jgi:hypothetical protein